MAQRRHAQCPHAGFRNKIEADLKDLRRPFEAGSANVSIAVVHCGRHTKEVGSKVKRQLCNDVGAFRHGSYQDRGPGMVLSNLSRRPLAVVASLAALALLGTACGSSTPPPAVGQTTTSTGGASPIRPSAGTRNAITGHGLLACVNSDNLELIDPKSGSLMATAAVTARVPTGWESAFHCDIRDVFSADLSRLAVRGFQADGSLHVGYVDLATGTLTDVTAKRPHTGFGAALPSDCNPLFGPTSNTFWYLEGCAAGSGMTVHRVDLASGTDQTRGTVNTLGFLVWASDQAGESKNTAADVLLNRSRTLGAVGTSSGISLFTSPAGPPVDVSVHYSADQTGDACLPKAWAGDSTLICTHWGEPLEVLQVTASTTSVQATPLLPTNTRFNFSPVSSPDGSVIAFLSKQGTDVSLYTIALARAGTEPTLVASNVTGLVLIAWQ